MEDLFGNREVKALTWREPYGALMLAGKVETRSWSTYYRGLVLMCAGQRPYRGRDLLGIAGEDQMLRIDAALKKHMLQMRCGYAFAVGRLVHCRPMTKKDENKCFVKYDPRLYCHIYSDVRAIDPIEWKGMLGWQTVPDDVVEKILV